MLQGCLEENTLAGYVGDGLDAASRDAVVEHAASCDACRRLIVAAVQAVPPDEQTRPLGAAAPAPPALARRTAAPGERWLAGKYQLVRLLGAGGMGTVHEAINTWTGRRVAVKELHGSFAHDTSAVQRFMLEAQSASRIAHPNVVDILDLGFDAETGALFMVQELLAGATLRERLVDRGALAVGDALELLRPVLAALVVAHAAGVVHRDLKPENIFLARDLAGREVTKLIDFGLSKRVQGAGNLAITDHGRQLGTPLYMSPEQVRGDADLDDRTDVWSFAVVVVEVLAGARPFTGATYPELVANILRGPPPRLATLVPGAPAALLAGLAAALERDPAHRPRAKDLLATVDDVRDELRRAPGARAVPTGNPYRGLLPFEAAHRGVFFGRAGDVAAVIERLRGESLVVVAGDSGVGKSSLVRAGVAPRLPHATVTTPGRDPRAALAAALGAAPGEVSDPAVLGERLQQALGDQPHVIILDQLEELITLAAPAEAAATATALCRVLDAAPGLRVLATARTDFLGRLAALPGFADRLGRALYLLGPLTADGVREAIAGPARVSGAVFESPALIDELVAATAGRLPLLQFALAELWQARDTERNVLTAAALARLGGVAGALARHADGVIDELSPRQREVARRLLTALVGDAGTRVRRTAAELADRDGVLEALVRGRLVTVDGDPASYQIAHDTLVDSWDTLRGWRGHAVERDVARVQLERIAAAWDRGGRPGTALWTGRQLAAATALDGDALSPLASSFLVAARRARGIRRALALGVPLLLALGFAGARWSAYRERTTAVAAHVARADHAIARAHVLSGALAADRADAFAAFDRGARPAGEAAWTLAIDRRAALVAAYVAAGKALEDALALDGGATAVRRRLAAVLHDRAALAERDHLPLERDEQLQRMLAYDDDGAQRARWAAPARLEIASSPAGARVTAQPIALVHGARELGPEVELGHAPLTTSLAAGSYLLVLRAPGRPAVRAPVLLARGEALRVATPIPAAVPAGYVFVPPGRFLYGSNDPEEMRRSMLNAQPLHATTTPAYLIARHEVTFGDWIGYLRSLSPAERARRLPNTPETASAHAGAFVQLSELRTGELELVLRPTLRAYTARLGEPVRYADRETRAVQAWERMPVSGISWDDARAYAAWLDATGALPGARPCDEREWERAARGADDRLFPHADQLTGDEADFAETYGRRPAAFGPDEVGSHPASDSPFGVADLAGNAWEWVASVSGDEAVAIRGGSWYHNPLAARTNNREPCEPSLRAIVIGLRICAAAEEDRP